MDVYVNIVFSFTSNYNKLMRLKVKEDLQAPQAHFLPVCESQSLYPSAKGKCPAPGNLALKHKRNSEDSMDINNQTQTKDLQVLLNFSC